MYKINKLFIIYVVLIITTFNNNSNKSLAATSKKYNRFLAHIFNKYGNGGTMSFEGLEHLMYNLGIGGLEFNPTHTIEEHHPNDYKLPDLILNSSEEDDLNTDEIKQNKLNQLKNNQQDQIVTEINNQQKDILYEFKELHDPKHRHPRDHDKHEIPNYCLSPQETLKLVIDHDDLHNYQIHRNQRDLTSTLSPLIKIRDDTILKKYSDHNRDDEYYNFLNIVKLTPEIFMKLCPALLVQMDQNSCINSKDDVQIKSDYNRNPNAIYYAWIYASIAIFILSACGLIGVAMVPLMKSIAYKEILRFLVAVAVGTLAGDALMHLLPHALITEPTRQHSHSHSNHNEPINDSIKIHNHNEPVMICACTFLTIVFMYFLENIIPLITGRKSGHGHSHGGTSNINDKLPITELNQSTEIKEINTMMNENKNDLKIGKIISKPMTPVAFMVVLGDGLHNLTDGLAIGASFASDPVIGMATAFAVLCHELPHELGDFALLLQTGMSIKRAIYLNIISSVLSFMGMAIGLLIVDLHTDMVKWIYACTAGSFLYIALATLIPEMGRNDGKDIKNIIIQIFGILVGGLIMLWIGLNEDRLIILFQ